MYIEAFGKILVFSNIKDNHNCEAFKKTVETRSFVQYEFN